MKNIITFFGLFMIVACMTQAQPVVGLWHVTEVTVGNKLKTPVSKWIKLNEDGTRTEGNGWTQNVVGLWTYDEKTKELTPHNDLGSIREGFAPFKVKFQGDTMQWTREEYGMQVLVTLTPTQEMPPAPADLVKGLWALDQVKDSDDNELLDYDKERKQYIFIRQDMLYRLRLPDQNVLEGFWHMHGHSPTLTLINYDRDVDNQVYRVSFMEGKLIMKSADENGNVYLYSRIHEFPN
ncbi:hypothetical protein FUAX_45350 (plasmid) [Fulvitalea axinellae]|uniref:Lipocalin-like domain-containing protein n=1 Tax=Fulvitalea axinellae TaxID=1182444 RepID=A0AAU9CPA5_9BACT|nr:hypothetical protein FUAX_45350 [Fulvitalea axinellae]